MHTSRDIEMRGLENSRARARLSTQTTIISHAIDDAKNVVFVVEVLELNILVDIHCLVVFSRTNNELERSLLIVCRLCVNDLPEIFCIKLQLIVGRDKRCGGVGKGVCVCVVFCRQASLSNRNHLFLIRLHCCVINRDGNLRVPMCMRAPFYVGPGFVWSTRVH